MLTRLFDRWAKSSKFTAQEMRMLQELIPKQCIHSLALLSQASLTPFVNRMMTGFAGFEAVIPYVEDDSLLIESDYNIKSPDLEIVDSNSGRRLAVTQDSRIPAGR